MSKWYRATEKLPKDDQTALVYYRGHFYVGNATIYEGKDFHWENEPHLNIAGGVKEHANKLRAKKGDFYIEIGTRVYFDNPEVFWMNLPKGPSDV